MTQERFLNVTSEQQYMGPDFLFGLKRSSPHEPPVSWNPDSHESVNQHLLICGLSGAGKSTLLKQLTRYLQQRKKHIYMFDLQGDLELEGENHIEFNAWNSKYGINPYEFDAGMKMDVLKSLLDSGQPIPDDIHSVLKNSGPLVQVSEFVEIIKKNFMQNMGQNQEPILKRLISDTYKMKGILHDDYSTWFNPLPSLEDTKTLIEHIEIAFEGISSGVDKEALKAIKKISKILEKATEEGELRDYDEKTETSAYESFVKSHKVLDEYLVKKAKGNADDKVDDFFTEKNIDVSYYMRKDIIRVVQKLTFYVEVLIDSGVFHADKPPIREGLNRINISGLRYDIQRFMADVFLGKVFRACKARGEYAKRIDKPRGKKHHN